MKSHTDLGKKRLEGKYSFNMSKVVPQTTLHREFPQQTGVSELFTKGKSLHYENPEVELLVKRQKRANSSDELGFTGLDPSSSPRRSRDQVIVHNWQTPDDLLIQSMNNIFSIAISKTINKAIEDEVPRDVRHQISKQLFNCWNQGVNPESFRSRLKVTKLPSPLKLTLDSDLPSESVQVNNTLNIQELGTKQKVLNAYLEEETQQLEDLKQYLSELELGLSRDKSTLRQYRQSVEEAFSSMDTEISDLEQNMRLDQFEEAEDEVVSLDNHENISDFDANKDPDIRTRLEPLQFKLETMLDDTTTLRSFNDRLESVYNLLD